MPNLTEYANAIRFLAIDMVEAAKSGHPGMPMGMADVATVLFRDFLTFNPEDPYWLNRDRFILSNGHGSALLYAALYLTGYEEFTIEELTRFRQLHSKTPGHPEYGISAGIETTTGPLGQGLANAVGIAIAERVLNARYGDELVSHKTYVMIGDGCLMEGISQEAISLAGHLGLKNLVVLFDDNNISIDGATDLATSDNHLARFQASGWDVRAINGHNETEIHQALSDARDAVRPTMIACKTVIGYGSPNKAGTSGVHGSPLGAKEVELTRQQLAWSHPPFIIPQAILNGWRQFASRNINIYETWNKLASTDGQELISCFGKRQRSWTDVSNIEISKLKEELTTLMPNEATRRSSQRVLERMLPIIPELIGGSADLTPSNNTHVTDQKTITRSDYSGSYLHYGVREHGMGAVMNGLALSGFIPYGGSFLSFTDYMRPAIRLAAIMRQQVIYVMTHDSICLGEDGPTHQPVEHLPSLRAIPHLKVLRPCDAVEVAECWQIALQHQGPTVLALTRQHVPCLRSNAVSSVNMAERGAYVIMELGGGPCAILLASGSEVHLACQVAQALHDQHGLAARVVSVPDLGRTAMQDAVYMANLLADRAMVVVIEAAKILGWSEVFGPIDLAFGVDDFGASAPAEEVYHSFGFTTERITKRIMQTYRT